MIKPARAACPVGYVLLRLFFSFFLMVPLGINYLRMYQTDLYQIFRTGRIMDEDERSDLRTPIAQKSSLW